MWLRETLRSSSEAEVLELVGLIYDAAGDPSRWPVFLERLGRTLQTTTNNLFLQKVGAQKTSVIPLGTVGMEPTYFHSYLVYYGEKNVYLLRGARSFREGNVYRSEEFCQDEEATKTEFWNDWIVPQKMRHALYGVVLQDGPYAGMVNLVRRQGQRPFARADLCLLQALLPHLQRALQLHLRIVNLETQKQAATDTLNHWSLGVILLDAKGQVLLSNRAAESILNRRDGLALQSDGLHAATPRLALRSLIHEAIQARLGQCFVAQPGGTLSLPRPSAKRPLNLLVTPVCANDALFPMAGAAAIFVSDPEADDEPDDEILRRLYGLSVAETRIATLLLQGKCLPAIAEQRSISLNTAKTQAKRIYEKTGARGQAEFIRLVLRSAASVSSLHRLLSDPRRKLA